MRHFLHSIFLSCLCAAAALAESQPVAPGQAPATPEIQDLGNQRYRIGEIEVDKAAGLFRVAGQVLRDEPPLEFLVVTRGGYKAYESVLEVNADAYQFNLACILIGLDSSLTQRGFEGDPGKPVPGDPVEVLVSWKVGDKVVTVNGAELMAIGEPPRQVESSDWVYTGSFNLEDGRYLADLSGTLIGFVHREESIIEHQQGIGVGHYGSALVNRDKLPPVGSSIELTIRRPAKVQ